MVTKSDDPNDVFGKCNYCGKYTIIMRILRTREFLIEGWLICDDCHADRTDALMADMSANGYVWDGDLDEFIEADN